VPSMLIRPQGGSHRCLVYLHANAEDIGHAFPDCSLLAAELDCLVLAPEYPGYGICQEYACTPEGMNAVAVAGHRYALEVLNVPQEDVCIFGRSIGTGPACVAAHSAAARGAVVGGLILFAPFFSMTRAASALAGSLAGELMPQWWDNGAVLGDDQVVDVPLLVIHGAQDDVIPCDQGRNLFKVAKCLRKLAYFPPDMDHNVGTSPKILAAIRRFWSGSTIVAPEFVLDTEELVERSRPPEEIVARWRSSRKPKLAGSRAQTGPALGPTPVPGAAAPSV